MFYPDYLNSFETSYMHCNTEGNQNRLLKLYDEYWSVSKLYARQINNKWRESVENITNGKNKRNMRNVEERAQDPLVNTLALSISKSMLIGLSGTKHK